MSSLMVEGEQQWVPTHVLVTVLRGRGLQGKSKHGTSDAYAIIQLGKEKYSTGVAEKTTEPEWGEECTFELQPDALESGRLVLTVMHRGLVVQDVFLGQAVIQLGEVFHQSRCLKNHWYRLQSKSGKKEKERGDIQVTIQFTRNNLTASMYDLLMKEKGASPFTKLKERIKGKRRSSQDDASSAVLPGGYASLYRLRQRMPSDGGGEEDYEDDEGGEVRRSKMRTFFFRGKLRKTSDTRSSTSVGSESSESSSRGGSLSPTAGISVVVSDLSNSPSNSSNLTADNSPEHTANTSPDSTSLKPEFGDETGEISIAVPQQFVFANGSHAPLIQPQDPGLGKPACGGGLLQKSLPVSVSLQNLSTRASMDLPKGPAGDGRRWSFDRASTEEKAAMAAALEGGGPMRVKDTPEAANTFSEVESDCKGKQQRRDLITPGRSEPGRGQTSSRNEPEQVSSGAGEKVRSWFGSKDKPSSCPPMTHLMPQPSSSNPTLAHDSPTMEDPFADAQTEGMTTATRGPPPPSAAPPPRNSSNPFRRADRPQDDVESQWDQSFEAFAAGRLQSPVGPDLRTQESVVGTSWFSRGEPGAFRSDDRALNPANSHALSACTETKRNSSTNTSAAPSHSAGTPFSGSSSGPGVLADGGLFWFSQPDRSSSKKPETPCELGSAYSKDATTYGSHGKTQTDPEEPQLDQENRARSMEVPDGSTWDSPVNNSTGVQILGSNDDPSFFLPSYIFTSSPHAQQGLLDHRHGGLREQGSDLHSGLTHFPGFTSTPDSQQGFTDAQTLDHSGTSLFPSLYVSAESQDYQTCRSPPSLNPSGPSEPNQTVSKNSLLWGEGGDFHTTADETLALETSITERHKSQHSFISSGLKSPPEGGGEVQHADSTDPRSQKLKLQRSRSEGTLAPPTPSFESDAVSRRRSSLAPEGSRLLSLTPPAPQSISFPVALPPCANLSVRDASNPSPEGAEQQAVVQRDSPHPVKPLTATAPPEEERSKLASGLEKLKSTIHPGRGSHLTEQEDKKKILTGGAGSYYHLTHSQLVALLVQREAELQRHQEEFKNQKLLLAKREAELKKLKPQVRDLEDYIDTLLVRIMEQKPTLLQVRSKLK
ncbi:rab11 family-interacting protein 5 isoform X2 [Oryzias latipes]|uniref:rab11 family-interacting protein 5 isoform X2 n=1 Tax=Oryzias latipes TaxID=8090 RepID=UPI0009DB14CA|nr:rab11 family-interacting protein 5 isoform X2 [Oryzias latipes]